MPTTPISTIDCERYLVCHPRELANALKDIFNDVGELPEVRARFESVYRDVSHYAGLDDGTWHCMTDAPKDGTEVELLLRHVNYRYCTTDEDRARWEQVVRSTWIDFNGGGWTWHGMAGSIVGWRPLPSNV